MTVERVGALVVLTVAGRLGDAGVAAHTLQAALTEGMTAEGGLVVDLSGVDYLSSPGISLLERLVSQASALRRPLAFCGLTDPTRIALDLAGITNRLPHAATRADALSLVQGHSKNQEPG